MPDNKELQAELTMLIWSVQKHEDAELTEIEGGRPVDSSMVRVWKRRITQIRRQLKQVGP